MPVPGMERVMAPAREPIDPQTADRLLTGRVAPDDAPPGYRGVSAILGRMRAPAGSISDTGLVRAMAGAITVTDANPRRKPVLKRLSAKTALVAATVALSATGAAAATGDLPDAAQDGLARAASHVGVNLPESASDRAREVSAEPGPPVAVTTPTTTAATTTTGAAATTTTTSQTTTPAAPTTVPGPPASHPENHGAVVSETAHEADPEGGKGEEVAPVARDNHGQEVSAEHTPPTTNNGRGPR
jgi:hypothetical protein